MSDILKISYDQFLGLDFSYSKTTLNQGGLLDLHKVCSTVITFRSYFTQKIPVCQGNLNQGCFEFERFQLRIKSNEEILIYLLVCFAKKASNCEPKFNILILSDQKNLTF